jgi:hypothetical protein
MSIVRGSRDSYRRILFSTHYTCLVRPMDFKPLTITITSTYVMSKHRFRRRTYVRTLVPSCLRQAEVRRLRHRYGRAGRGGMTNKQTDRQTDRQCSNFIIRLIYFIILHSHVPAMDTISTITREW